MEAKDLAEAVAADFYEDIVLPSEGRPRSTSLADSIPHTFVKVAFDSGRLVNDGYQIRRQVQTYDYLCDLEAIGPGDQVVVPVKDEVKVGDCVRVKAQGKEKTVKVLEFVYSSDILARKKVLRLAGIAESQGWLFGDPYEYPPDYKLKYEDEEEEEEDDEPLFRKRESREDKERRENGGPTLYQLCTDPRFMWHPMSSYYDETDPMNMTDEEFREYEARQAEEDEW